MITFYTAIYSKDLENIKTDVEFPENGLSPAEQIAWIDEHIHDNISVKTFSPYIMNELNVLILQHKLTKSDIDAYTIYEGRKQSLIATNTKTNQIVVDTYDLSEPMTYMMQRYQALKSE